MITSYRSVTYDMLVSLPFTGGLAGGSSITVDKKFHPIHAIWCFLLGLTKALTALYQIFYLEYDVRVEIIFWAAMVVSVFTVLTEFFMILIIGNAWEAMVLSRELGIKLKLGIQKEAPSCMMARHLFVVEDEIESE